MKTKLESKHFQFPFDFEYHEEVEKRVFRTGYDRGKEGDGQAFEEREPFIESFIKKKNGTLIWDGPFFTFTEYGLDMEVWKNGKKVCQKRYVFDSECSKNYDLWIKKNNMKGMR